MEKIKKFKKKIYLIANFEFIKKQLKNFKFKIKNKNLKAK